MTTELLDVSKRRLEHVGVADEPQPVTAPLDTSYEPTKDSWSGYSPLARNGERIWLQWATSRRGSQQIRAWGRVWSAERPDLRVWSAQELVAPIGGPRTDWMQGRLLAMAQRGDSDAVHTLTIQLRPGLLRIVSKTAQFQPFGNPSGTSSGRSLADRREARSDVLSIFQLVLYSHDLQRRPTKIAANLLLDTRQHLWREAGRTQRLRKVLHSDIHGDIHRDICGDLHSRVPTTSGHTAGATAAIDETGYFDELSILDSTLRSLPGTDASRRLTTELAYRSWVLEESNIAIARQLSISPETVNTRLHRLRSAFKHATSSAS